MIILIYKVAIVSKGGRSYGNLIHKSFFMLNFFKNVSRYALGLHECFAPADKCCHFSPLKHFLWQRFWNDKVTSLFKIKIVISLLYVCVLAFLVL